MASFGGAAIFGRSTSVLMVPNVSEAQVNAFFGVSGVFRMHGGSRGRRFFVAGVLAGANAAAVAALRATILSYDDGIARTLVDNDGVSWPSVVFTGEFVFTDEGAVGHGLWCRPYRCAFDGLI